MKVTDLFFYNADVMPNNVESQLMGYGSIELVLQFDSIATLQDESARKVALHQLAQQMKQKTNVR